MKHERSLQEQTIRIDEEKQDRPLLVREGERPERAREGIELFDGKTFAIRYGGKWVEIANIAALETALHTLQTVIAEISDAKEWVSRDKIWISGEKTWVSLPKR